MADKKYHFEGKMPAKVKRDWIAALKSGKYKQTKHALENSEGNCCLGVLCRVLEIEGRPSSDGRINFEGRTAFPPTSVLDKTGLTSRDGCILTNLNDNAGKTFAQIARIIERNIKVQRKSA